MEKTGSLRVIHAIAVVTVLAGAVVSLDLMLKEGRNNDSFLLMVLFSAWVLSPFIALLLADLISNRWSPPTRMILYWLMIGLPVLSVVAYAGTFTPPDAKPAFIFLIAPLIFWLLIIVVMLIAISRSRKRV